MTRKLICINCPIGCELTVVLKNDAVTAVEGNSCLRGEQYARDECVNPKRTLTTTIRVVGSEIPLAVRSSAPIPKDAVPGAVAYLKTVTVQPPIYIGDRIAAHIPGQEVDIIACQDRWI